MEVQDIKIGNIVSIVDDNTVVFAEACGMIGLVVGRAICREKDTVFVLGEKSKIRVTKEKAAQYGICLKHLDKGLFSFANPASIKAVFDPDAK